jgi:hypothetical protein
VTPPHNGVHASGSPVGHTAAGATHEGTATSAAQIASADARASADAGTPSTLHDLEEAVHQLESETEHRPPSAGPVTNVVVALVVIALGVAALAGSLALGVGNPEKPGAGMWPLLISLALVVLGLALVPAVRSTADAERFTRPSLLVLVGMASMIVFVALISVIGFEIPAALLAFVWLRFLGNETWRSSIVVSLGVVVAFYLVFVAALQIPIPHLF